MNIILVTKFNREIRTRIDFTVALLSDLLNAEIIVVNDRLSFYDDIDVYGNVYFVNRTGFFFSNPAFLVYLKKNANQVISVAMNGFFIGEDAVLPLIAYDKELYINGTPTTIFIASPPRNNSRYNDIEYLIMNAPRFDERVALIDTNRAVYFTRSRNGQMSYSIRNFNTFYEYLNTLSSGRMLIIPYEYDEAILYDATYLNVPIVINEGRITNSNDFFIFNWLGDINVSQIDTFRRLYIGMNSRRLNPTYVHMYQSTIRS